MVGVDDEELLDLCLMLRRWGRRSETYLFGSRRARGSTSVRLPTARPMTSRSCSTASVTTSSRLKSVPHTGSCNFEKLADYNGRRKSHWQRLDGLFDHYTDIVDRPRTTDGADTVWTRYPFLVREGIDRQHDAARGREAAHHEPDGVERRHPAPSGFAASNTVPAGGLPNSDRVTDSALSLPSHHTVSSDDVGRMMTVVADVFDDVAKMRT